MSGILLVGLHCLGLHNFQILRGINRGLLEGSVAHRRYVRVLKFNQFQKWESNEIKVYWVFKKIWTRGFWGGGGHSSINTPTAEISCGSFYMSKSILLIRLKFGMIVQVGSRTQTRNTQHAARNLQQAARNSQHANRSMQSATRCEFRVACCMLQLAACSSQLAARNSQYAIHSTRLYKQAPRVVLTHKFI